MVISHGLIAIPEEIGLCMEERELDDNGAGELIDPPLLLHTRQLGCSFRPTLPQIHRIHPTAPVST